MKTQIVYSAGGVVLREVNSLIEVLLIGQSSRGIRGLPKGGPHKGETLEQTALRETAEETGLQVKMLAPIADIDYWFASAGKRFHKTVHYFLMAAIGGDISRHDKENDTVMWLPVEEAYKQMSYKNEVAIVRKAVELWLNQRQKQQEVG